MRARRLRLKMLRRKRDALRQVIAKRRRLQDATARLDNAAHSPRLPARLCLARLRLVRALQLQELRLLCVRRLVLWNSKNLLRVCWNFQAQVLNMSRLRLRDLQRTRCRLLLLDAHSDGAK